MLIFAPPLKEDFRGDSDYQFDNDSQESDIESLGAYLHLIFMEIGF